jgi:hypothetical protein
MKASPRWRKDTSIYEEATESLIREERNEDREATKLIRKYDYSEAKKHAISIDLSILTA